MLKAYEILKAWTISFNPTEKQQKIAIDRFSICESCEFKKETFRNKVWSYVCNECGCPLQKKIYSPVPNACPKKFWDKVDKKNGILIEEKENHSLF